MPINFILYLTLNDKTNAQLCQKISKNIEFSNTTKLSFYVIH